MNENEKNLLKEVEKLIGSNLSPKELANKTPHPKNTDKAKVNSTFINQLIAIYKFLHRVFYLFIRLQKEFLKIKTTKWQEKLLKALLVAPDYGSIIFSKKSRLWIDHLVSNHLLTKEQKFILVWSRCINYKRRSFSTNFQDNIIDKFAMLYFALANWIFLLLHIFLILSDTSFLSTQFIFALLFIYFYFHIVKFYSLILKTRVWDSNILYKQIVQNNI